MAAPAPIPEPLPEPLRMPRGSVRGFLALALMATFGFLLLRDSTAPAVLVNATVVVLAFYFGTHGSTTRAPLPAGVAPPDARHARILRALLLLGFAGLGAWFLWRSGSWTGLPSTLVQILEVLGGYVLGLTLSWAFHRRAHESPVRRRLALLFRDLSAVGALGLTALACYAFATGVLGGTFSYYVEQALSLVITYYFGSRVLAR